MSVAQILQKGICIEEQHLDNPASLSSRNSAILALVSRQHSSNLSLSLLCTWAQHIAVLVCGGNADAVQQSASSISQPTICQPTSSSSSRCSNSAPSTFLHDRVKVLGVLRRR